MSNIQQTNPVNIGMLAHVDAGKTTLSEAMLFRAGSIRKLGRVDNQDTFLDTGDMERARGITIFSKQAAYSYNGRQYTLLDTPGHVDFSAETERTLWVLDVAVLVISGMDGVQGHTETLWSLLKRLGIPVFIFVNKMDQQGTSRSRIIEQLKNRLSGSCVDFNNLDYEEAALCQEEALEQFLESGEVGQELLSRMIMERKIFPVYFGSALKVDGVNELMEGIDKFARTPDYGDIFKAKIYKITRDERGERLTHLKVCGGVLRSKMLIGDEKVNQIRVYAGDKFSSINEAVPGTVCAVTGLNETRAGQFIGEDGQDNIPVLEPVLNYRLNLPAGADPVVLLSKLRMLEEEEPELHVEWDENFKEIHVSVMGPVLIEVLSNIIKTRFGVDVTFGEGSIVYKETIGNKAYGIGHFEPLRHYAEVHLLLEPGEPGSGMKYQCRCSEDILDKNWQRLVYTHLCEKTHRGVLTGSELTDMVITLVAGRAHPKHTEGGDFRQATYRAVRQGLMQAESVLLEPFYAFSLEVRREYVGRAMTDFERMGAAFTLQDADGDNVIITGEGPVSVIGNYQAEVNAYTKGSGRLALQMAGYRPCHNTEEVLEKYGYDPERDTRNPADSVFCAGGSGYVVPWNEVREHAHVEIAVSDTTVAGGQTDKKVKLSAKQASRTVSDEWIGTDEVDRILNETYFANSKGDNERRKLSKRKADSATGKYVAGGVGSISSVKNPLKPPSYDPAKKSYLLVDGYNIIHAFKELSELAEINLDSARGRLIDILCNYQAMKGCELIVVFDAYRVAGHDEEFMDYHNIHVVFTKTAETADHYIEKFAHENGKKYNVTVATSDGVEQVIIRGQGCLLISAREFEKEIAAMEEHIRESYLNKSY